MDGVCSYRVIRFREHRVKILQPQIDEVLTAHPQDEAVARLVGSFLAVMDMTETVMGEVDSLRGRCVPVA